MTLEQWAKRLDPKGTVNKKKLLRLLVETNKMLTALAWARCSKAYRRIPMPLKRGKSPTTISRNIHELTTSRTKAGKARTAKPNAHAVNVAIAMGEAYDQKKTKRRKR